MSDTADASPPLSQPSWGLWSGLEALSDSSDSLSIPGLQNDQDSSSLLLEEAERVTRALTFSNHRSRKCRVPQCLIPRCNLVTHQMYRPTPSARRSTTKTRGPDMAIILKQLELSNMVSPASQDALDGFPALPIKDSSDPVHRSLFHHFFFSIFDRLSLLFRGPSITNLAAFKGRMLGMALSSEAYCSSLILLSQTEQDLAKEYGCESEEALNLYNKTLQALRKQVQAIHTETNPLQIELALLVLCVLLLYDGAHGRREAQRVHWQGLRDLVSLRGGMHAVTLALAYAIHADRCCAVLFDELPISATTPRQTISIPIPSPVSLRYGSRLHAMRESPVSMDRVILEYCIDSSALVELWEEAKTQKITRRAQGTNVSTSYVHYTRDRLDEQFAVLNAQPNRPDVRDMCVLWATRLIEYPCTWSSYFRTMTKHLSYRLASTLQSQDLSVVWYQNSDMLLWVMFTLATIDSVAEVHSWVISCLRQLLDMKHGSTRWPRLWWVDEQENLLRFVWSSSHYAGRFKKICDELERTSAELTPMDQDPTSEEIMHE